MSDRLVRTPVTLAEARRFVASHHRHLPPPRAWRFGVGLRRGEVLVAVGMAARPVGRGLDDGVTLEVSRVCTLGDHNAASMVYGALCRAAEALGHRRAVTYTREDEPGTSLRASGFEVDAMLPARAGWDAPTRRRQTTNLFGERIHDQGVGRVRWVRMLGGARDAA